MSLEIEIAVRFDNNSLSRHPPSDVPLDICDLDYSENGKAKGFGLGSLRLYVSYRIVQRTQIYAIKPVLKPRFSSRLEYVVNPTFIGIDAALQGVDFALQGMQPRWVEVKLNIDNPVAPVCLPPAAAQLAHKFFFGHMLWWLIAT